LEDKPEKLDKHRFLVQSRVLTDDEFILIKNSNPAQRAEEVYTITALLSIFQRAF
jgi:hypothetical protein